MILTTRLGETPGEIPGSCRQDRARTKSDPSEVTVDRKRRVQHERGINPERKGETILIPN